MRDGVLDWPRAWGPKEALNGTTVLNTLAVLNKASILRVHDVVEAKQVVDLVSRSA